MPQRERVIRADHCKLDFLFLRKRQESGQIFGADIHALNELPCFLRSFLLNSGVARRAPQLRDVR